MLIVTALGGGADYTTEMPSMNECLDARVTILSPMKKNENRKSLAKNTYKKLNNLIKL